MEEDADGKERDQPQRSFSCDRKKNVLDHWRFQRFVDPPPGSIRKRTIRNRRERCPRKELVIC